ncbi:MAG: alpha/beta fold hydrolase [Merismopedia sp. SIO2A8]|nr:alpha/beta fold hydrolase [Merismopedia sp. SIO2A8]
MMPTQQSWNQRRGMQRDWRWRGWNIRYSYCPAATSEAMDNPPFLLIHGFGSSLTQWDQNIVPLSQYGAVYGLDLLGFGWSEKAAIAYDSGIWADQIYAFWQQFIRQPIILVGHSLGALVSATVAVDHPEMVQRLVLITVPTTRQDMISNPRLQSILGSIERLFTSPLLVRLIFNVASQPRFIRSALRSIYIQRDRVTDDLVNHFVTPTLDRGAAQTLCRLTQSATQSTYSRSRQQLLHGLKQPTLILWGEKDMVVPLKGGELDIQANPHITLVMIPNAGHCVYDEAASKVNEAIAQWL